LELEALKPTSVANNYGSETFDGLPSRNASKCGIDLRSSANFSRNSRLPSVELKAQKRREHLFTIIQEVNLSHQSRIPQGLPASAGF
jgi:hypothetical protein